MNDTEVFRCGGDRDRREALLPAISNSVPSLVSFINFRVVNFKLLRSFAEVSKVSAQSSYDVLISAPERIRWTAEKFLRIITNNELGHSDQLRLFAFVRVLNIRRDVVGYRKRLPDVINEVSLLSIGFLFRHRVIFF